MKSSKQWFSNRLAIAIFSFAMGVLSLWGAQSVWRLAQDNQQRVSQSANAKEFYDRFFKDDFFETSQDPFAEMQEMHKRMMERFEGFQKDLVFENQSSEIQTREDERFVYYDILIGGDAQKKLEVKVEDGQVHLSAEVEKKLNKGNQESTFISNFHRSLPVPENTDPSKVEILNDQGKIILKFPKV